MSAAEEASWESIKAGLEVGLWVLVVVLILLFILISASKMGGFKRMLNIFFRKNPGVKYY